MASSPETYPEITASRASRISAFEICCLWLLLVIPLGLIFFRLGIWLMAIAPGLEILIPVAFAGAAVFTGVVLQVESAARVSRRTKESNSALLIVFAALLPLTFGFTGIFLLWNAPAESGYGSAVAALAAFVGLGNCFSWCFAHFLIVEISRGGQRKKSDFLHPALFVSAKTQKNKYLTPLHPVLTFLAVCAFFTFAFTLRPSQTMGGQGQSGNLSSLFALAFVLGLFVLLVAGWFYHLIVLAKRERIGTPQFDAFGRFFRPGWIPLSGLFILVMGLLAAALPLHALVRLGDLFRLKQPPEGRMPAPVGAGEGISLSQLLEQLTAAGSRSWLLLFSAIIACSIFAVLLYFWAKRAGLLDRLKRRMLLFWQKLRALLVRFLERRKSAVKESGSAGVKKQAVIELLDDAETLARLGPAQAIMAIFHMLLEYAALRKWLPAAAGLPPLEMARLLGQKGLSSADLNLLAWSYSQAAYSDCPPEKEDFDRALQAWVRLKPRLMEETEAETGQL